MDWVRRFLAYAATPQGVPAPRVDTEGVREFLTHLAVQRQVSASTQNQAFSALLFLCREVLGLALDDVSSGVKAKARSAFARVAEHAGNGVPARRDVGHGA